jgi:prophage regulatory protein
MSPVSRTGLSSDHASAGVFPRRPPKAHMAQDHTTALTILRRKQVEAETGYSRSTIYLRISQGLWVRPVALGARAVGWPAREVWALNTARIAGKSEAEIRALVKQLVAARVK